MCPKTPSHNNGIALETKTTGKGSYKHTHTNIRTHEDRHTYTHKHMQEHIYTHVHVNYVNLRFKGTVERNMHTPYCVAIVYRICSIHMYMHSMYTNMKLDAIVRSDLKPG